MKIESTKPELLDELFADFSSKHIHVTKEQKKIDNAQGDITLYLNIAGLALQSISTFLDVITFFNDKHQRDDKHFIHVLLSDGRCFEFENLSKDERTEKLKILKDNFKEIKNIKVG